MSGSGKTQKLRMVWLHKLSPASTICAIFEAFTTHGKHVLRGGGRLTKTYFCDRCSYMARKSWVDPDTNEPLIDDYAKKLHTFAAAFSDGVISEQEISDQEARLVDLMKEIEPLLDDATHARVTRLLCELTAYDIMQFVFEMQQARATAFRG